MKALVYNDNVDLRINNKPKPKSQDNEHFILKTKSTTIYSVGLRLYRRIVKNREPCQAQRNDITRIVHQSDTARRNATVGTRLVIPFNIVCFLLYYIIEIEAWSTNEKIWINIQRFRANFNVRISK